MISIRITTQLWDSDRITDYLGGKGNSYFPLAFSKLTGPCLIGANNTHSIYSI
jgi:hypothetical protein